MRQGCLHHIMTGATSVPNAKILHLLFSLLLARFVIALNSTGGLFPSHTSQLTCLLTREILCFGSGNRHVLVGPQTRLRGPSECGSTTGSRATAAAKRQVVSAQEPREQHGAKSKASAFRASVEAVSKASSGFLSSI